MTSDTDRDQLFQILERAQSGAETDGRLDEAMLVAMLGYLLFRALKDDFYQTGTLMNLHQVAGVVLRDTLGPEAGPEERKLTCSFWARTKPEVRLVAGHSGAICESCAKMASTIFAEKTDR